MAPASAQPLNCRIRPNRSPATWESVFLESEVFTLEKHDKALAVRCRSMIPESTAQNASGWLRFRLTRNLWTLSEKMPIRPRRRMLDLI